METVVLLVLAIVVAIVAIDAIARLDQRRPRPRRRDTKKVIVDLTKRR